MSSKSILIGFSIFLVWKRNIRAWKTFLGACSVWLHIPNNWRFSLMVQTCFKGMPLQWARRRVRSGSLFKAIFLKVNPGFWSSWLTWRREQHNEGWKSGGKGAQKYGGQEDVVQETLTSPVSPPPLLHPHWQSWIRKCCVTAMRSITRAQALEVKYSAKFGEKNRAGIRSLSLK